MKKKLIYTILILAILSSCQRKEILNTHGISYLEKREKLALINKSNKNDIVNILGQPATTGMSNDNLWIYIERTLSRGKLLKLGQNTLKKNNVLVLEFNKYGILISKNFFDKNQMNKVVFAKDITVNEIKKENFIKGFLSSVRAKMDNKKK